MAEYAPLILTLVAALIAGVPPTIAALAAYKQSLAALAAANKNTEVAETVLRKTDVQAVKTENLIGKVDEVHTITNSNLAAVKAELAQASQRIEALVAMVADLKAERGKSQMREAFAAVPGPTPVAKAAEEVQVRRAEIAVQEEIAANTAATAEHTDPDRRKE